MDREERTELSDTERSSARLMGESYRQARDRSEKDDVARFPTWLVGITLALTFATFALVAWAAYGKYRAAESFRNRESRIQALHGIILRLDEVLTMSARMAAATGDLRWEQRYRLYDPQLDAAIAEAEALVPGGSSIAAIAGTDAANVKLVAMENRAFALVRAGHMNEAHAVLSSPVYETQKVLYSTGLDKVMKEQQKRLDGTLAQARQHATLSLAASAALLLFSMATWFVILARLRGMQGNLEHRITERTAELSAAAQINVDLGRRSSLILNSVTEGIVGLSSDGQPTFLNPAAERMLGRSLHDFDGITFHAASHHSHPDGTHYDLADCAGATALRRGESITAVQDLFWRSDGSSFAVEYSATPAKGAEGGTASVMTFRDVTERRAIERLKDEFVSTVSHELRTPLTSIRGALGLLQSGMLGNVADKGQRMLEIAVTNTDRLVRLINDILDLERIESGKMEMTWGVASANDVMTEASESVQEMARHAGVAIVVQPIHASLWIDRDRIIQTLINLLSNAVKFSPSGTTVTLSGRVGEGFTFRVVDQGRGVPADKIESIFERFRQVDASDSRDKGGSGLGLAICRSIVKAHDGRIWVESDGVSGSVFQLSVPQASVSAEPSTRESIAGPAPLVCIGAARGAPAILIVEDDFDLASVMTASLQAQGLRTFHAATGSEAIAICREHEPLLIVLDLALPDMDGFAVVKSLRDLGSLVSVPLVVYSALEVKASDQARLALGPTQFLTKSRGSLQHLESHVLRLLNSATAPSADKQDAA